MTDTARILSLCESLEQDITALRMTERIEYDFYSAMIDTVQEIAAEITAPPKSNADRIRQMTDEELSEFLGNVIDHCNFLDCENCPMERACTDVPMSRDKWLKQEVSKDAGTN